MDRWEQARQELAQAMALEDDDWDAWLWAPGGLDGVSVVWAAYGGR